MARESVYNGRKVFRPDLIEVGNMVINPNAPPLDEAMRFCRTCVAVWLNKYGIWSERVEDIEDLESECVYRTYKQLIRLVVEGKYRKDLSFYLNCRSCAWASISYALKLWRSDIQRKYEMADIDDNIPNTTRKYSDVVTESVRWRTDAEDVPLEQRGPAERPLESYKRQSAKVVAAKAHIDYWYELYQEMCLEHCVEPMDKDQWVKDNIDREILDIAENKVAVEEVSEPHPPCGTKEYWRLYRRKQKAKKLALNNKD